MEQHRLEARVSGRVQGVGYRHYARARALRLGLRGWVRNEYDGTVRVVAEGPRSDLETYLDYLRRGPTSAHVRDVEVDWEAASGSFKGFEVRF